MDIECYNNHLQLNLIIYVIIFNFFVNKTRQIYDVPLTVDILNSKHTELTRKHLFLIKFGTIRFNLRLVLTLSRPRGGGWNPLQ